MTSSSNREFSRDASPRARVVGTDPRRHARARRALALMWTARRGPCRFLPGVGGAVQLSPDDRHLFVLSYGSDSWPNSADRDRGRVVGLDLAPDGSLAYAGCYEERVTSGCLARPGLKGARGIALAPDGRQLYALAIRRRETRLTWWSMVDGRLSSHRACVSARSGDWRAGQGGRPLGRPRAGRARARAAAHRLRQVPDRSFRGAAQRRLRGGAAADAGGQRTEGAGGG